MLIRFVTSDGLTCFAECLDIERPLSYVLRPMWHYGPPQVDKEPTKNFREYRKYEFRGEVQEGIPTVYEV